MPPKKQVSFDEGAPLQYSIKKKQPAFFTGLVIKASGGLIKTETQANAVLILIAVVALVYSFLSISHKPQPTPPQPVQYDTHGNVISKPPVNQ